MGDTLDIYLFRLVELIDAFLETYLRSGFQLLIKFSLSHNKIVLQIIFITLCMISLYLTLPLFSIRLSRLFESWVC